MKKLDKDYLGWDTHSHLQAFDVWNKKTNFEFNFIYGIFAGQRYLFNYVKSNKEKWLHNFCFKALHKLLRK